MAKKKAPKPLQPGAWVAGLIRKSEVVYPPECVTVEQRAAHDEREIDKRKGVLRDMAAKDGEAIAQFYIDWAISGRAEHASERAALIRLEVEIDKGNVRRIYTEAMSRVHRDVMLGIRFMENCIARGTHLVAGDLGSYVTAADRFKAHIMLTVHQYEAEIAGERIREKNYQAVKQGQWVGLPHAPFGYALNKQTKGVDADPASVWKAVRLFELCAERSANLRAIARALNEEIKSGDPQAIPTIRAGGFWSVGNLRRFLLQPIYLRQTRYGGEIFEAAAQVPEVVPLDLVIRAREAVFARSTHYNFLHGKKHAGAAKYTYAGLLACSICGRSLNPSFMYQGGGTNAEGKRFSTGGGPEAVGFMNWRCTSHANLPGIHDSTLMAEDRIDSLVLAALQQALADEMEMHEATAAMLASEVNSRAKQRSAEAGREGGRDKNSIERERAAIEDERSGYIRMCAKGIISDAKAAAMLAELDARAQRLEAQAGQIAEQERRLSQLGGAARFTQVTAKEAKKIALSVERCWRPGLRAPADSIPVTTKLDYRDEAKRDFLLACGIRVTVSEDSDGSYRQVHRTIAKKGTITATVEITALGRTGAEGALTVQEPDAPKTPPPAYRDSPKRRQWLIDNPGATR